MNAKATYYLQLVTVLILSIVANCGYASVVAIDRGRLIQSVAANRLGGFDRETTDYDFAGNPVSTVHLHTTGADTVGIRQEWERLYDRHGRELFVRHRIGSGSWMHLSDKDYDAVGRVTTEAVGSVESTYEYDVRSRPVSTTSKRYSQWLSFTAGGNVSRMTWHSDVAGEVKRSYTYGYDALSRLTSAEYSEGSGTTVSSGKYSAWYEYDLNGNVTSLSRRGPVEISMREKKYGFVDRLTYQYRGNQVTSITDEAPDVNYLNAFHFSDGEDVGDEYLYDANGNTITDLNRGIWDIHYDVNNRPRSISFASGAVIRYIYSADSVKLRTEHIIPGVPPVVAMDDADPQDAAEGNPEAATVTAASASPTVITTTDYCGRFIYEDGALDRINLDNGYLSYRDASGNRLSSPQYHFFLRDHLGNNRVDLCAGDASFARVNHYYTFGLPMYIPGSLSRDTQRWKFGNKEFDRTSGLDLYDFEARAYDPATIRFYRPDDFADTYLPISLYAYCANNPLRHTDTSGKYLETLWDIGNMAMGVTSLVANVQQGNIGAAVVDGVGVILDAATVIVPGVPGGVGTAIKAYRAGKSAKNTADVITQLNVPKSQNEISSTATSNSTTSVKGKKRKQHVEKVKFIQGYKENAVVREVNLPQGYSRYESKVSNGQKIYSNGKYYITPDRDGHNGGVWKMAKSVNDLHSRDRRMGTYNEKLERIGD